MRKRTSNIVWFAVFNLTALLMTMIIMDVDFLGIEFESSFITVLIGLLLTYLIKNTFVGKIVGSKKKKKKKEGCISISKEEIKRLKMLAELVKGQVYFIEDEGILIRAKSKYELSKQGSYITPSGRSYHPVEYDIKLGYQFVPGTISIKPPSVNSVDEAIIEITPFIKSVEPIENGDSQEKTINSAQIIEETQIDLPEDQCRCPNCETINYRTVQSCTVCGETQIL